MVFASEGAVSGDLNKRNVAAKRAIADTIQYVWPSVICQGSSGLQLTANNAPAGATFQWQKDGNDIPGAVAQTYQATGAGAYSVDVIANGTTVRYDPAAVTESVKPTANYTFSPGGLCSDVVVQFTNASTGATRYVWDFDDPSSGADNISNSNSPSHKFSSIGSGTKVYAVKLTAFNSAGCSDTKVINVSIKQKPDASLDDFASIPKFVNCQTAGAGSSYTLTVDNTSATLPTNTNYEIDWGDGSPHYNSATFTSLSHTYTATGYFDLVLKVTGANGCVSQRTYRVFNGSNPSVSMGNPGNTQGCAPIPFTFPITGTGNNPPGTVYTVSFNDGSPDEVFTTPPTSITHTFTKSSCGYTSLGGIANSFHVRIVASNPCGSSAVTVEPINVSAKPTAQISAPLTTTCVNKEIRFSNTSISGAYFSNSTCSSVYKNSWSILGTPNWTVTTGTLGSANPTYNPATWGSSSIGITFSQPGTYTLTLYTGNSCGDDSKTVVITVNPLPVMTSPNTKTICSGSSVNLALTSDIAGSTFKWSASNNPNVSGDNTAINNSSTINQTLTNTSGTAQQVTYTVTPISPVGCEGTPQTVTVTVNPAPALPTVTGSVNYCVGETANPLSAAGLAGSTLNWYTTATGGTPTNTAPTPSTAASGITTYYVSQTTSGLSCESARASITVTVTALPIAPPVSQPNLTYCQGETAAALNATVGSGNTLRWYTVATGGTPSTGALVPSTTTSGTFHFYVSRVNSAGCEGPRSTITVVVNPTPAAPVVVSALKYCQNEPASALTATADAGNTLRWYNTLTSTTPLTSITPSTSTLGSRTYYVSQRTSNNCESPRAAITVTINPIPAAPSATSLVSYCKDAIASALSASASAGNTLFWYESQTGGTPSTTAPVPSTAATGSKTYYVSQKTVEGCESSRTAITVTVNPVPVITSVTSANPSTCSGTNGKLTLNGLSAGASYTLNYTKNGTLQTATLTSNGAGTLELPNLSAATYDDIKVSLTGCTSNTMGPYILQEPPAPATPAVSSNSPVCSGNTLKLQASTSTAAGALTYQWTGPNGYTSTQQNPELSNVPVAASGTYTVTVTQNNCVSSSSSVTVTINPTPSAPTTGQPVLAYCKDATASALTASASAGNTLQWYESPTGGMPSTTAPVPSTATTGSKTYYVSQKTAEDCESSRTAITVTVNPVPAITAVNPTNPSTCFGSNGKLSLSGLSAGTSYTLNYTRNGTSQTATLTSNAAGTLELTNLSAATYDNITVSLTGCTSNTMGPFTLQDPPAPATPSVNSNSPVCSGKTLKLQASTSTSTATGTLTYQWTGPNGYTSAQQNPELSNVPVTASGTYTVTVTQNDCVSSSASVTVTINQTASAPAVTSQISYCLGEPASALTATAQPGNTLTWYTSATATAATGSSTAPIPVTSTPGTISYFVSQTTAEGCESARAQIDVTVHPTPTLSSSLTPSAICSNSQFQYTPTGTVSGSAFSWSRAAVPGISTPANNGTGAISETLENTSPAPITVVYTYTITANGCHNTQNVEVKVNPGPVLSSSLTPPAICSNTIFSYTPQSLTTGVSFSWTRAVQAGISNSAGSGIDKIEETLVNTTDAPIEVSYVYTLSSSGCSVPQTVKVVVNPSPQLSSTLSPPAVCNNTAFSYQPTSNTAGLTYIWSRAQVSGISNAANSGTGDITETLINTTSEPIEVVYKYTLEANSCQNIQEVKVKVNPTPVFTSSLTPNAICSNSSFSYSPTSSTTNNSGQLTFNWSRAAVAGISNPAASGTGNPNETLLNTGSTPLEVEYVYTLRYNGCSDGSTYKVKVTVNPSAVLSSTLNPSDICTGEQFNYTPTSAVAGTAFQWSRAAIAGISNPAISGNTNIFETLINTTDSPITVVYTYTLTANGCSSTENVSITVNPHAKAEYTAAKVKACVPFDLSSVISPVPYPDRNASYTWYANNVLIGIGNSFPGFTIQNDGETVDIKLVTESKYGCQADSMSLSFSTIKAVTAAFTKDLQSGCGPLAVSFNNTSSPLAGANYEWNFGDGQTSTLEQPGTITFQAHPMNRDTTYTITLKASTDCQSAIFTDSVKVRPQPKVIFSPDKTIGCSPFTVKFRNQSRGIPNTYTFDFGNGDKITKTTNEEVSYTFTTGKTDTLTVKLIAENECGKDSSSYEIVVFPNTVTPELVVAGNKKYGCAPFTVKFDNNSTGANAFTWDFKDGSTLSSSSAPESQEHTFNAPGIYEVTLLASNGCSDTTTTETITVYPKPLVDFSTLQPLYCAGDSVELVNNSPLNNFSYIWDFGDGQFSNQAAPKHPFPAAGKYMVKLTAVQTFPDGTTCSNSISHEVEIIARPVANFNSNAGTRNCAPFSLTVFSTPANAANVEWDFGDAGKNGNQAAGHTATYVYTEPGLYAVKAKAYNLLGCIDSAIQYVQVTASPVAQFTTPDTVICGPGGLVHFTNTSTYKGADLVTYKWFVNNTQVSTFKDLSHVFSIPSGVVMPRIFNVRLVASSTLGCSDTVEHTMQFNPLPKAIFTPPATIACVPFRVNPANTSLYADHYKWYLDDVLVSTDKDPKNVLLTEAGKSFTLKLVVSNNYACREDSLTTVLSTYPKPTAQFSLQDSISCNGKLDISISNTSTGAVRYLWNFGDNTAESTAVAPAHTYAQAGTYELRLVAFDNICSDTLIRKIYISKPPKSGFIANTTSGCTRIEVNFQNLSDNTSDYLWDFGDGTYSSSKNPTHSFNYLNSPYTVKLIATGEFGCADTAVMVNYIRVTAPPMADFKVLPDTLIKIPDYTFHFVNTSEGNPVKYRWVFGDGKFQDISVDVSNINDSRDVFHTYTDTGTYTVQLIATNIQGCNDTLSRQVRVQGVPGYLYVPNAFEPNNTKDDVKFFKPVGSGMAEYSVRVFNKWGQVVWQSSKLDAEGAPLEGWDGTYQGQPAPQDVYVWDIDARFFDGSEWKGMKYQTGTRKKSGPVHLIR